MTSTSRDGVDLIKQFEGLRLEPYLCAAGVPTIGYGHTRGVTMKSRRISQEQADDYLRRDLLDAERAVQHFVTVAMNDNQFAALVSFVFNVGLSNFLASTLRKKLNAGEYLEAASEFQKWVYAGKKRIPGLVNRRAAEKALFLKPVLVQTSKE